MVAPSGGIGVFGSPGTQAFLDGDHFDAVDGAGRETKIATGAVCLNDCMKKAGRPDDGIHRTRLDAQRAADAALWNYPGGQSTSFDPVGRVQGTGGTPKQLRQFEDAGLASRRALIDVGSSVRNGLCVGAAPREAAFRALCLRQDAVDLVRERFHRPLTMSATTLGPR